MKPLERCVGRPGGVSAFTETLVEKLEGAFMAVGVGLWFDILVYYCSARS